MESQLSSQTVGKYPKDSFKRFGDDLCGYLLDFLNPNDKFRLECVSKQWKQTIHRQCTKLILGWGGLDVEFSDILSNPHILDKCSDVYKYVRKIEFSSDFQVNDNWFDNFPLLKELLFTDLPSRDIENINKMKIGRQVQGVSFIMLIGIENEYDFDEFERKFAHCARELRLEFLNETEVLIKRLSSFKNLQKLCVYNDINNEVLSDFSKALLKLEYLEFGKCLDNKNVISMIDICETFKSLKSFRCRINSLEFQWLNENKLTSMAESIKSIGTRGYRDFGCGPYKYVHISPSDGICLLENIPEFNWLSNKAFSVYKTFIFNYTSWPYGEDWLYLSRMFKYGVASTIIIQEKYINQNLIDLFKEKATNQPEEVFVISTIGTAKAYRILDNFYIYLTKAIIENGLINYLPQK